MAYIITAIFAILGALTCIGGLMWANRRDDKQEMINKKRQDGLI